MIREFVLVWSVNTSAEYLEEGPLAERLGELDLVAASTLQPGSTSPAGDDLGSTA